MAREPRACRAKRMAGTRSTSQRPRKQTSTNDDRQQDHGSESAKLHSYAWEKIAKWIRRKHNRVGWPELRRRFCDKGWRFASEGVIFTGASSVAVNRYRYRGSNIATPWTPKPTAAVTG